MQKTNYSITKKECLAVVWGVQVFRPFLVATHFEILTDHYALQWLRSMKSTSAILHRWAAALEDYRFTILHRPGKLQGHVDALSRLPTENLMFTLEGKIQVSEERSRDHDQRSSSTRSSRGRIKLGKPLIGSTARHKEDKNAER